MNYHIVSGVGGASQESPPRVHRVHSTIAVLDFHGQNMATACRIILVKTRRAPNTCVHLVCEMARNFRHRDGQIQLLIAPVGARHHMEPTSRCKRHHCVAVLFKHKKLNGLCFHINYRRARGMSFLTQGFLHERLSWKAGPLQMCHQELTRKHMLRTCACERG